MEKLIILNISSFLKSTSFVTTTIWAIIFVFITTSILVSVYTFIVRYRRIKKDQKEKKLIEKFQEIFYDFLFSSEDNTALNTAIEKFKPYTKNKFDKSILLKTIHTIHQDVIGDIADKLKILYVELELVTDSIKKMKSSRWHIQIKGMRELSDMKIKNVVKDIEVLTSHPNTILRKEAQLSLVKINGFKGLNFLNTLEYPLSEWQQLLLLETVQWFKGKDIPRLENFLASKNHSVIIFTLKLIRVFSLINLKDALILLLYHENEKIKTETIFVLGELYMKDQLTLLKSIYFKSTKRVQLKIIEFFEKVAGEEDVSFLIEQLKLYDYDINIQLLRAIKSIEGKQKLEVLKGNLLPKQQELLLHVLEE